MHLYFSPSCLSFPLKQQTAVFSTSWMSPLNCSRWSFIIFLMSPDICRSTPQLSPPFLFFFCLFLHLKCLSRCSMKSPPGDLWCDFSIVPQLNHLQCTLIPQTVKEYWLTSHKRLLFLISFVHTALKLHWSPFFAPHVVLYQRPAAKKWQKWICLSC